MLGGVGLQELGISNEGGVDLLLRAELVSCDILALVMARGEIV